MSYRVVKYFKTPRKTCLWAPEQHAKIVGSAKDASGSFKFLRKNLIFMFKVTESNSDSFD